MTDDLPSDPVLTGEAARIAEVGEMTIRRWADSGRLTVRRTGNGLRVYSRGELERVAAERALKKSERWPEVTCSSRSGEWGAHAPLESRPPRWGSPATLLQVVLVDQPVEGLAIYAGGLGGCRHIAIMARQNLSEI